MPLFSVIVPNYNHASYLKQRIDSILNQTFQDFELILLDDCSTDNSREVLKTYQNHPKVSYCVFSDTNSGNTFQQWDKGIHLALGKYIWIAESDDVAELNFLRTIEEHIFRYTNAGLFFSASKLIDDDGIVTYENEQNDVDNICYSGLDFIKKKLIVKNSIWNASMMVFKRSLYKKIDMQKVLQMKYCGDWFFYTQLAENTSVVEIKKVLNSFRVHTQNVSTTAEKSGKSFTEGLEIYDYQKKYLNFLEIIKFNYYWAKFLQRSILKYEISPEIQLQIFEKVNVNNHGVFFLYKIYCWLKKIILLKPN